MKSVTYKEISDKVKLEADIGGETFITPDELIGYFNDAIEEAESEMLDTHEDYFLRDKTINLVDGKDEYSLPNDIYVNKIREIIFDNGSILYEVRRINRLHKFENVADTQKFGSSADHEYYLEHQNALKGTRLILVPAARSTGPFLRAWYIREAAKIPLSANATQTEIDETIIDIPEANKFILQFVKDKIREKDNLIAATDAKGAPLIDKQRRRLVNLLKPQVEDDQTNPMDLSHYWDHS